MSSSIYTRSSIIVALLLTVFACGDKTIPVKIFRHINLRTTPIFHYTTIGSLTEAPVNFVESWNRNALQEMGVHRIWLYSKGGKNPDDTLEEITFDYSENWQTLTYNGFKYDETPGAWTSGTLLIPGSNQTGQILFSRHFGIMKQLKTLVQPIESGILLLRSKAGNRYDSTWVIGTFANPSAIVSKIGKSVFSVELYVPEGSSTRQILEHFQKLPISDEAGGTAQCSVIFTKNGKPRRAFLLNDQFSQVAKIREWTYTHDDNIASYQEWTGNVLTKAMSWHYGKSQLPEYTIIDRNTYFYRYE